MLELIWAMISLAHRSHRGTKLIFFRTRRSETCSYFIQYRPSWSDKQDSKWAAINKKKDGNFWKSSFSLLLSKKYCSSFFFSMLWKLQSVALNFTCNQYRPRKSGDLCIEMEWNFRFQIFTSVFLLWQNVFELLCSFKIMISAGCLWELSQKWGYCWGS